MSAKRILLTGVAAAALTLPGYAQTPSPAPPAPPRPLRGGRTVVTRSAVRRGWLGVGLGEITPERAKALKLSDQSGVEVTHVDENSPASKAGLKENDAILEVNGQKVDDAEDFARMIGESAPGSKVTLGIWRGGAKQNISATLEARPVQFFSFNGPNGMVMPTPPEFRSFEFPDGPFSVLTGQSPRVGFEGETLTPQLAEYFGVKEGVLVRTVTAKTPAEKAGLKAGDVITKVGGTPVSSPREISGLIRATRKTAAFTVVRNHKEITLNVEIAERRVAEPDREVL
jgi:serine protease Do